MVPTSPRPFPWISITRFPQVGQPYAFADRKEEVARLYKATVAAGNAVRADQPGARYRAVVSGYKGVGKSSVIMQVLGMIRDPLGVVDGQVLTLPPDLPEPENRERWLILSVSGKLVPSVDAIADALQKAVLSTFEGVEDEVERRTAGMLDIRWYHHLFKRREKKLFTEVQSALTTFSLMIDFVRAWQGSRLKESVERSNQTDTTREITAYLEGQLKVKGVRPESAEGEAALKLSGNYIRKWTSMFKASATMERESIISADLVTDALNAFFKTTDKAGIPTILVLDDFDEFASNVGPSHGERSRVLANVLGTFNQLRPTCLFIGVREEYMHEDVFRQFDVHHIPPMTRRYAGEALDAWARVQLPPLTPEASLALQAFGDRFLAYFAEDAPVVVPFRFLQMVAWIGNNALDRAGSDADRILAFLRGTYNGETFRAVHRLANVMPVDDIALCAEAVPIEPELYSISPRENRALVSAGLLRPAMAGDAEDTRVVIDPLIAYLSAALRFATATPSA
jgi:Cdc6-like AAA superfamily ATPase